MKPTIPYLREKFAEFNAKIFAGRLEEPAITLCEASSFVGQYKRNGNAHTLRFSTSFDLPESELEDTLIHEMLHYFIAYNGLHDRTAHGPLFKALMQSVNEHHGRAITISRRSTPGEIDAAKSAVKKWHVIAILHFTSGATGVKVLPRVIPKILEYHKNISAAPNIKGVDLYLHNDPFFNRYPTSTGRRCHAIEPAEIKAHLKGAHLLKPEGNRLVQR